MIFKVYMKDPDVLHDGIDEALEKPDNLDEEEWELIKEKRHEAAAEVASKWFEYGEYLTVEIDTEKETIRVVPIGEDDE